MLYTTHMLRHLRVIIGQNIHRLRTKCEMTIHGLSSESGLPKESIERYEIGKNDIQLNELLKIACALGVLAGDLLE
jgi:transcriptional regulator with XRE-family HTH domain